MAVCSDGLCWGCSLGLVRNVFDFNDFNEGLREAVFELTGVDVCFGGSE